VSARSGGDDRLTRLSGFLYGFALALFVGTIVELLASKHWQEPLQFVPFALCVLGAVATWLAWKRPGVGTIRLLRVVALVNAGGALLGTWEHIEGNVGFVTEMHPDASGMKLVVAALTGRAPLLAAGALVVAAVIALAASYAAGWQPRPAIAPARVAEPARA